MFDLNFVITEIEVDISGRVRVDKYNRAPGTLRNGCHSILETSSGHWSIVSSYSWCDIGSGHFVGISSTRFAILMTFCIYADCDRNIPSIRNSILAPKKFVGFPKSIITNCVRSFSTVSLQFECLHPWWACHLHKREWWSAWTTAVRIKSHLQTIVWSPIFEVKSRGIRTITLVLVARHTVISPIERFDRRISFRGCWVS